VKRFYPYIKDKYFRERPAQVVFNLISAYVAKYHDAPTKQILLSELDDYTKVSQAELAPTRELIEQLTQDDDTNLAWRIDKAEQWCQARAVDNGLFESITIVDECKTKGRSELSKIFPILHEALSVSFQQGGYDMNIHDLLANYTAPDYLIENLFKRGYVYSLTGATGSEKTCVALCIAMYVATNTNLGERTVKGGRVVYFAGENPDDVTQRLMGMTGGEPIGIDLSVKWTRKFGPVD
jgi:hypothetical protein